MLTRRKLLATTGASVLALSVAACSSFSASQIQQDVAAIAAGLASLVSAASSFVPPNILAQVTTIINSIESNAALIGQALTPSTSLLQNISAGISALSALLAPFFPMAPGIAMIVQAALALMNVVLTATGVITPPTPASVPAMAFKAMSPGEARAILQSAAAGNIKPK